MKTAAVAGVATVASFAGLALYQNNESINMFSVDPEHKTQFDEYIASYGKSFGTKAEYEFRLNQFSKNMRAISEHNDANGPDDATLAPNHMMDWTSDEYKKLLGFKHPHHKHHRKHHGKHGHHGHHNATETPATDAPTSVDWRNKGGVTPVKNQGQCGSCWAFSTTGAMEGAEFVKTGTLKSYSEQQLVDCSSKEGNQGCNGGLMDNAFKYAEATGLDTEAQYPYTGRDGTCHAAAGGDKVTSYTDVTPKSAAALMAAVQKQPVAIAVDAGGLLWQFYHGGIMGNGIIPCGSSLDHGVLLVGYGSDNGKDYWIVKNSWGASWGEKGYVRLARPAKHATDAGVCGLQLQPSFPVM